MDTCRAHRCVKKAHASFFPSSLYLSTSIVLDEIHAAQTDCFADDYIRNFNKAQREGSFLYYLFKKSTQLSPYEMGNILIFANNFLGFIAINWHNFDLSFNKLTSQQTYLGTFYSIRFDPSAMQKTREGINGI